MTTTDHLPYCKQGHEIWKVNGRPAGPCPDHLPFRCFVFLLRLLLDVRTRFYLVNNYVYSENRWRSITLGKVFEEWFDMLITFSICVRFLWNPYRSKTLIVSFRSVPVSSKTDTYRRSYEHIELFFKDLTPCNRSPSIFTIDRLHGVSFLKNNSICP